MNVFTKIRLYSRAAKHLGAFARARQQGMSQAEAQAFADKTYPPTAEDAAFKIILQAKERLKVGRTVDPLQEQATRLVGSAKLQATTSLTALLDEYPVLKQVDPTQWDFFVTVGAVFIAISRLANFVPEERTNRLTETVAENLDQWSKYGLGAFEDCKAFFERTHDGLSQDGTDPTFIASDALGSWIVWNVLERRPELEDMKLAHVIGAMTIHTFYNWWKA